LRLTFATLGAFSKYPRESEISTPDISRKSQKKYGFFQSDRKAFKEVAKITGLIPLGHTNDAAWCRHPLTFLVEAADDICYSIIDMEDGTNLGLVPFSQTRELLSGIAGGRDKTNKADQISSLKEKTGYLRAMAISTLIQQTVEVFLDKESDILKGEFDMAITDMIPAAAIMREIQKISLEKIYRSQSVIEKEVAGFEVLNGLMSAFAEPVYLQASKIKLNWRKSGLIRLLPLDTRQELNGKEPYAAMLTLLDFISGLTDTRALSLFRNIKGISLPGFD
jgi:dGTPase